MIGTHPKPLTRDRNGLRICNSAGEPMELRDYLHPFAQELSGYRRDFGDKPCEWFEMRLVNAADLMAPIAWQQTK